MTRMSGNHEWNTQPIGYVSQFCHRKPEPVTVVKTMDNVPSPPDSLRRYHREDLGWMRDSRGGGR